ncbi:GntR family transcriptional regulator [Bacillus sp. CGMCC 1.16607]|uniref:GntR family transcriptional regulator n=1 Tax=Bacillus sp. CGMCC 1.16607 TaxID=3351842 RepID=UPI00363B1DA0
MGEDFHGTKPIYLQLVDRIHRQIIRGEIKSGEKLPSVREMAIQSGVNPNTVQRTYSELERMNTVETRRGQGTFVTENEVILSDLRKSLQLDLVREFTVSMTEMGFTLVEMIEVLKKVAGEEETPNDRV